MNAFELVEYLFALADQVEERQFESVFKTTEQNSQ